MKRPAKIHRPVPVLVLLPLLVLSLVLAGCNRSDRTSDFTYLPVYGDGTRDDSQVVAQVGDITITTRNMEQRLRELPETLQARYKDADGQRLLLDLMVNECLNVLGAVDEELYRDQDVQEQLISQRRETLSSAMVNYGVLRDKEPTEEELRQFYDDNREKYRTLETLRARHIELPDKKTADAAWARLQTGKYEDTFATVCGEMSVNEQTRTRGGETGWFNPGAFVKDIPYPEQFTAVVAKMEEKLNPPVQIGSRWHIVEILEREPARYLTYREAKDRVKKDMMPGFQDALVRDHIRQARAKYGVQLMGKYQPGQGMTPEQLFAQAMSIKDEEKAVELLRIIYLDYPKSDRADDALFMCGTKTLKVWQDRRVGARYLHILLDEYPDSEFADDAQLVLDNLYNPAFWEPKSIEDLQKLNQ